MTKQVQIPTTSRSGMHGTVIIKKPESTPSVMGFRFPEGSIFHDNQKKMKDQLKSPRHKNAQSIQEGSSPQPSKSPPSDNPREIEEGMEGIVPGQTSSLGSGNLEEVTKIEKV